ncbi:MAG: signal peptidase II [Phenylobacterium sp.]|nr:MAG: signal peptidase II [Phenylobacterium sp.]
MKHTNHARWAGVAAAALIVALDQLSKAWALHALAEQGVSRPLVGWLRATLVFNRSNAFGLAPIAGELSRLGLAAFNLAMAAALLWWLFRRRHALPMALGAGVLAGGAVGNAVDRVRLGYVVDFLDLSRLGFPWIFNVADSSVDLGIALLALGILIGREATTRSTPAEPREGR